MSMLIYTFYSPGRKTHKVLKQLGSDCHTYFMDPKAKYLNRFIKNVETTNYDYILGIADFRKGAKRVRVETKFINRYGLNNISATGKDVYLPNWIPEVPESYLSTSTTNGPCNKSGYLIMKSVEEKHLKTKFSFIHIPKDWSSEIILGYLGQIISNLNN